MLRATEEWTYVEREVDVRVVREDQLSRNRPEAIRGRFATGQL
jgi:hypothetical protein